jgi:hypothetical protein
LLYKELFHSALTLSISWVREATVITPEIRAATRPFLSRITVDGMAFAGNEPLNPIKIESSIIVGYGTLNLRSNASAFAGLSRVKIPINETSVYLFAKETSIGASARHGEHHDAQTFTTATLSFVYV